MDKHQYTDPTVLKMVKSFCNHVVWLRAVHNVYKELYENDEAGYLMENTAHSFFNDFNEILINYLLLEFAKITDPSTSQVKGTRIENFTVDNLIEHVNWSDKIASSLEPLRKDVCLFRNYIKKARNKRLAHYDKETFLNERALGGFPTGEDERFLSILEKICNITHEACFNSIFGSVCVSTLGDVEDLKKALKKALVFDRLFSESTGNEKAKLFKYLHNAQTSDAES